MGLLDELTSHLTGATGSQPHAGLLEAATKMLTGSQGGGLAGLVQHLTANGLGSQVAQWIGTGPNPPVSAGDLSKALGPERLNELAKQAGLNPDQAASGLSSILPHLIDKLTPNGQVPAPGVLQQGLSWLTGKLG